MSEIEWTEETWNPVSGCSITSPGCKNCYAMRQAARLQKLQPKTHYNGTTHTVNGNTVWTGKIVQAGPATWVVPLKRQKPTTFFVNSMGDLFHPNVAREQIDRVFAIMALSPKHKFQILTKYPERMRSYLTRRAGAGLQDVRNHLAWIVVSDVANKFLKGWRAESVVGKKRSRVIQACVNWPLPNVALGVSVEDQPRANVRIPILQDTPAAVRFLSVEPLLGPINFNAMAVDKWPAALDYNGLSQSYIDDEYKKPGIDWVIVGGESGPGSRPMHPDWVRTIRDQCAERGVAFFFKQWGAWVPYIDRDNDDPDWRQNYSESKTFQNINLAGGRGFHGERVHQMQRVGKKAAGRMIDGCIWDERPAWPSEFEGVDL